MKNHGWWMIACCLGPLLLIFLAPVLGLSGNNPVFLVILAMFACHFMMMGGHRHEESKDEHHEKKEGGHHGCH